jgi:ferredoxin
MAPSGERAVILVCEGHGDDRRASADTVGFLRQLAPEATVRPVRGLCTGSRALAAALRQHAHDLVVLLPCKSHQGRRSVDELLAQANDLSPSGARVAVNPAELLADDAEQAAKLAAVTAASAAIVGAATAAVLNPTGTESRGLDRRALLTGRLHTRQPTPQLAGPRCLANPLCHLCVDSCPTSALVMDGGAPMTDTMRCDSCGACALACPNGLLQLSTMPRPTWESFLHEVLVAARAVELAIGVWWSCADADDAPAGRRSTAWIRLRVPCVRALTPAWVLQPLARGAAEVSVAACAAAQDSWGPNAAMSQLVGELCAGLRTIPSSSTLTLQEPAGTLATLIDLPTATSSFIDSPRAPVGAVSCVEASCTACGLCAERCPTQALKATEGTTSWALTFRHSTCVACGACVDSCPEKALTLRRGVSPTDLWGERELATVPLRRCVACGTRLPTAALAARFSSVGVTLPDDGRCGDCRMAGRAAS